MASDSKSHSPSGGGLLGWIEWAGNKLPDPAMLFVWVLLTIWVLSWLLAGVAFDEIDPRTKQPLEVKNQLSGKALATFLALMVKTFTDFPPLGLVLVALLGVGVAEQVGFINALIKGLLGFTPKSLLTPMVLTVGIISHSAGDTGYVLVVPLGGAIFYAAGRHPLAGVAAAFAAVAGGFSANFFPSGLDPLLQGFTQSAAQIIDPERTVNPLCNYFFTATSSVLIIGLGWLITDLVLEPRLRKTTVVDGDPADMPRFEPMTQNERRGLWAGLGTLGLLIVLLALACWPAQSPMRGAGGSLSAHDSPLMLSIVPLIFLLFLFPAISFGVLAGTIHSHRDVVKAMSKSMSTMGYYLVLAFFAAQFTYAFRESNIGALVAIKGAGLLQAMHFPHEATIVGIIILSTLVNLLIGSASAKWALLGPIFVPMLMQLGLSPELTQAAYRIGDSSTNIITPLMPYFPLVVAFAQRYVKSTGIGTMIALMLPYSLSFLATWTLYLLFYWKVLALPLGPDFMPYELARAQDKSYSVAVFSTEVTPPVGHPCMGGGIGPVKKIEDPLYAHGFVLLGDAKPIVLVAVDWCEIRNDAYEGWRSVLAEAAKTDKERVLVTCLHQHDAPIADLEAQRLLDQVKAKGKICDLEFHGKTVQRVAKALQASLDKPRKVTHLGIGQAKVEKVASNRRYVDDEGKPRFGRGSATRDAGIRDKPEGTIDPWLKTLSFWDGDQVVLELSCYATHPMSYYGQGEVSADFVGLARKRRLSDDPKVAQIYVSGCSGNVTAGKYNDGAPENRPILADRIYQAMKTASRAAKKHALTDVTFRSTKLRLEPRDGAGFTVKDLEKRLREDAKPFGQCLAAFGLSWRKRADGGATIDVPCVDLGPAHLVLLPAEAYVEYQLLAQKLRPDSFVVVMGYGECAPGYIPTDAAVREGDTNLSDWNWVAAGAEERVRQALTSVLKAK